MSTLHTRPGEAVKGASATSTGTLVTGAGRLRAYAVRSAASAGSAVFRDGGSGGAVLLTVYTPASAAALVALEIPGGGITFSTDLHVTLTQADGCTVVYAEGA